MGQDLHIWRERGTIFILSENLLNRTYMYRKYDEWGKPTRNLKRKQGPARYENYRMDRPAPMKKGKLYLLAVDGEDNSLFSHSLGIYLGGFRQEKGKPTFIREGIGIDKAMIYGTDKIKYYIGGYKKNRKHGVGFFVSGNGKMYTGEWKNGRLLGRTKRELTPEEKEKIEDYIRKINNLL